MNNFTIYFKELMILEINGAKKTFLPNTLYGFQDISDKDFKALRKKALKKNLIFHITDDMIGCGKVLYGDKTSTDKTTTSLITMNKGKKNKKPLKMKTQQEEVPQVQECGIMDIGDGNNE